jgi:hypothetical protein
MKTAYPIDRVWGRDDPRVEPRRAAWQIVSPRDLSDCLLEAYDAVAMRAAVLLRENGMPPLLDPRRELWARAEREVLGEIGVDLQVTAASVTALASLPDFAGRDIALGLEPRWMVVFARKLGDGRRDMNRDINNNAPAHHEPRYAFCSVELPKEVEPANCCAVFHDGLLGVRILRRG